MEFTQAQTQAIEQSEGNLQLIACAGSGKTEVVARRVVRLLASGLKPGNIVAFTFTDKAAAELKERITTRCREALGDIPGMAEMYVGTIHGFCLDLLMAEAPQYRDALVDFARHNNQLCRVLSRQDIAFNPFRHIPLN